MSKRLVIEPYWLHCLLMDWAFASFPKGGGLGYPSKCTYLAERIPQQAASREPWQLSREDRDEVALAIAELTPKHRLAITRAYKVWTIPSMADAIAAYGVTDRTWGNWAHEAGRELARKLERQSKKVCTAA